MRSWDYGTMQVDGGGEAAPYVPAKKSTAVQSPGPSDLAKLSPQVTPASSTKTSVGGSSFASPQFSPYTGTSGFKPTETKGPSITKGQIAGGAADLLFGVGSFKAAADNIKEVITGKDAKGKPVNRFKSAASAVGDTALGATNLVSTAALLVPGAGVGVKGGVAGLNAAVKGAKVAEAAKAVTPATSKAITTAVKAKNAAVEAAAAKSAKVVSAGDVVLESAMKGAQFVGAQTKGKAASGLAAGVIALGPGAAGASAAGKATTAITQSVNAAKKVTSAAESFVPKAAKTSTKVTSGGAVPDVIKPAVAASGVKAGTSGKVAQAVTAAEAIRKAAPVTNNPFYNNNPFKDTGDKKTTVGADSFKPSKATTDSQSKVTPDKSRVNQFNDALGTKDIDINKVTKPNEVTKDNEGAKVDKGKQGGEETKAGKPDVTKPGEGIQQGDIWNSDDPSLKPHKYDNIEVEPTRTEGDGGVSEPGPRPRKVIPVVPKITSEVEELNRKRKWNPSAIV